MTKGVIMLSALRCKKSPTNTSSQLYLPVEISVSSASEPEIPKLQLEGANKWGIIGLMERRIQLMVLASNEVINKYTIY
jgi:hypothetical protein